MSTRSWVIIATLAVAVAAAFRITLEASWLETALTGLLGGIGGGILIQGGQADDLRREGDREIRRHQRANAQPPA